MLRRFQNKNVGPMVDSDLHFARKLNVLTGNNSCGKSFLLDLIWFGITRCWPGEVNEHVVGGSEARPWKITEDAAIAYEFGLFHDEDDIGESCSFSYDRMSQFWRKNPEPKIHYPGLAVYMMADGSFAVFDPLRNGSLSDESSGGTKRQKAYVLSQMELWPKSVKSRSEFCNGVVADWALWQRDEDKHLFNCLKRVVEALCPRLEDGLESDWAQIDTLDKVPTEMGGDQPTLRLPVGRVRLQLASSAIRRMASLAYVLVWAVSEHVNAARNLGVKANKQIFILMDEIESHLHPRWQRYCIRGITTAVNELCKAVNYGPHDVQTFVSTHSPLVMSSLEDAFFKLNRQPSEHVADQEIPNCGWYDFDLDPNGLSDGDNQRHMRISKRDFMPQGTVESWLDSEAFDVHSTYSPEIEKRLRDLNDKFDHWAKKCLKADIKGEDFEAEVRREIRELASRMPEGDMHVYCFEHRLKQQLRKQGALHDAD